MVAAPNPLPAAVLWDLDGTLIDSESAWIAEEHVLVEAFGGRWSHEQGLLMVGNNLWETAAYLRAHTPVDLPPAEVVERLQAGVIERIRRQMPWRPGAVPLLRELAARGVPCAVVTMSWRAMADVVVAAAPAGVFDVVITGDEVTRGKPDPEPYLAACRALGVTPGECMAIEDSVTGSTSSIAAGVPTLVVEHVVPVPPRPGLRLLPTLQGHTPEALWTLARDGTH